MIISILYIVIVDGEWNTRKMLQTQATAAIEMATQQLDEFVQEHAVLVPMKKRGPDGKILPPKIEKIDGVPKVQYDYERDVNGKILMEPKVDANNKIIFKDNTPGISTPYYK